MKKQFIAGLGLLLIFVFSVTFISSAKSEKSEIAIKGMTCEGCESAIASALKKFDGVKAATVSHKKGLAVVEFDAKKTDLTILQAAIVKAGYTVDEKKAQHKNHEECPAAKQCGSTPCCPGGK